MDTTLAALLYFLLFRLSVLLLGGLSIYLGYRLFLEALRNSRRKVANVLAAGDGELSAKLDKYEINIKSVAPGTFFAAFGALIVIVVLAGNPPSFERKTTQTTSAEGGQSQSTEISVRDPKAAASGGAAALHQQAWQAFDRAKETARQAMASAPDNADYLDTYATLLFADGKIEAALEVQQKAVALQPDKPELNQKLGVYRKAAGK